VFLNQASRRQLPRPPRGPRRPAPTMPIVSGDISAALASTGRRLQTRSLLKRKEDSFVFQFLESRCGEPEQLSRPSARVLPFPEWFQDSEERYLAAEIALVELFAENCFVNSLQLSERELLRKKLETDSRIFELVSQALESVVEDGLVIEGKRRKIIGRKPLCFSRVGAGDQ
jgi:hypothetical protein